MAAWDTTNIGEFYPHWNSMPDSEKKLAVQWGLLGKTLNGADLPDRASFIPAQSTQANYGGSLPTGLNVVRGPTGGFAVSSGNLHPLGYEIPKDPRGAEDFSIARSVAYMNDPSRYDSRWGGGAWTGDDTWLTSPGGATFARSDLLNPNLTDADIIARNQQYASGQLSPTKAVVRTTEDGSQKLYFFGEQPSQAAMDEAALNARRVALRNIGRTDLDPTIPGAIKNEVHQNNKVLADLLWKEKLAQDAAKPVQQQQGLPPAQPKLIWSDALEAQQAYGDPAKEAALARRNYARSQEGQSQLRPVSAGGLAMAGMQGVSPGASMSGGVGMAPAVDAAWTPYRPSNGGETMAGLLGSVAGMAAGVPLIGAPVAKGATAYSNAGDANRVIQLVNENNPGATVQDISPSSAATNAATFGLLGTSANDQFQQAINVGLPSQTAGGLSLANFSMPDASTAQVNNNLPSMTANPVNFAPAPVIQAPSFSAPTGGFSLCFITTAMAECLGLPDDCEELTILRWFRDNIMLTTKEGQRDVEEYYRIAPGIVAALDGDEERYADLRELYISPAVAAVKLGEYDKAYDIYRAMVESLKTEAKTDD